MTFTTTVFAVEFGLLTGMLLYHTVQRLRAGQDDAHLWVLMSVLALSVFGFYTVGRLPSLEWRVAWSRWGIFQPLAALLVSVMITRRKDD